MKINSKNQKEKLSRIIADLKLLKSNVIYPSLREEKVEETLDELKVILQLELPAEYKELLKICNGATLFNGDVEIWGVIHEVDEDENDAEEFYNDQPAFDVLENNSTQLRWPGMPSNFVVIGSYSYGDSICLDLIEKPDMSNVILWDHEKNKVSMKWSNIAKWLEYELNLKRD